ncbi:hypothetical protein GCM10025880_07500 [Methylorubrum aminovorans]|nr:hypothetical protein GCM10025880_07500 [Methylorubrum aminovorans]
MGAGLAGSLIFAATIVGAEISVGLGWEPGSMPAAVIGASGSGAGSPMPGDQGVSLIFDHLAKAAASLV